jgi:hypothetical protein
LLYACENLTLTLREEHRLGVPENRVVRNIFGPKRDEEKGYWRRQHNEEFHDLYSSLNITRVIKSRTRWTGHVARMGERRDIYRIFLGDTTVEDPTEL